MYTFLNFWKGNLSLWKHKHNKTDRKKITICNMFMEKIGWKVMIILEKKRIVAINCKVNECTIFRFSKQYLLKIQQPLFSGENSKLKCTMKHSHYECHTSWTPLPFSLIFGSAQTNRDELHGRCSTEQVVEYAQR